ncbi:MAG TPA: methyltransferase domain-containing protein [Kofleriaceae bacterium]|jgi:SAM-dependent methyltransferase
MTGRDDPQARAIQVEPSHYDFERYDDAERWMSYWHQLRVVLAVRPKTVLEIGPGSGVFRRYLEHAGVAVKTLDIDASRGVDYVADLRELDTALPAGLSFDAVCAFQVLEHLPLADFETCLANLARRARPHVFLSLPYRGLRIRLSLWWGDHHFTAGHKLMLPWRHKPIPEHHWELGYPLTARKITRRIARHLDVVSRGFIPENPYHYLWQLRRAD